MIRIPAQHKAAKSVTSSMYFGITTYLQIAYLVDQTWIFNLGFDSKSMQQTMSDSSEAASSEDDDFLYPNTDPGAEEFTEPRRKRRKTGQNNKESAALGILGSDSEDDRPCQRWKSKSLREKGMGFVSSKNNGETQEEDEDEMSGVETDDTAGLRASNGADLGWSSAAGASTSKSDDGSNDLGTPLGLGFTPSSA